MKIPIAPSILHILIYYICISRIKIKITPQQPKTFLTNGNLMTSFPGETARILRGTPSELDTLVVKLQNNDWNSVKYRIQARTNTAGKWLLPDISFDD